MRASSAYGYDWRARIRPRLLAQAGGVFQDCRYIGGAKCERCSLPEMYMQKRSRRQIAHLDGNVGNTKPDNLAVLCIACHRAHDYKLWAERCRETRSTRKDQARPILQEAS